VAPPEKKSRARDENAAQLFSNRRAAGYRHRQNNKLIAICIAPFGVSRSFVSTVTTDQSHVTMQRRKHPSFVDVLSHDTLKTITGIFFMSFARSFEVG